MLPTLFKIVVSLTLLGWLVSQIDVATTWHLFRNFNLAYMLPALLLSLSGIWLSVYKWSVLLKALGHTMYFADLLRIFWIGLFFNNILPGRTGGDLVRFYSLSQAIQNKLHATLSVVLDRGFNLIGLMTMGILAFSPNVTTWQIDWSPTYTIMSFLSVLILGLMLCLPWIKSFLHKQIQTIYGALKPISATQMIFVLALALFYQTTMVLNHVLIARGLGQSLAIIHFFYLIPLTALATLVPISINGLGVREGTFALVFTQVGMTFENAVALSLLATLLTLLISLVGGILYAWPSSHTTHHKTPPEKRVLIC